MTGEKLWQLAYGDLQLLDIDPKEPRTFNKRGDGLFTRLPSGRSHTVGTNPESGYAFAFGAAPRDITRCRSGIIFIDMKDPMKPKYDGCAPNDGYTHDAQCINYRGPQKKYQGRELCYGYNEDTLTM